ncbi:MAG TPA: hypothetical protein VLB44_08015 [Kofleriaceae bacterium]|nr:hypothetical protein [Kofleriaceae bacterium]
MIRCLLVLGALAGCAAERPSVPAARTVQPPPAPASPTPPADEQVPSRGAVPIPAETPARASSDNHVDRSVDIRDVPSPTARWRERVRLPYRGRIVMALHVASHEHLELTVVDTVTETESGYPGSLQHFGLGPVDDNEQPPTGNAFSPRDVDPQTGEYAGPVMFAVRLLPREGAPETDRRQYVVYTSKHAIFVAEKLVTESAWTPRLRIDAPRATELVAMDPGWH